MNCICRSIQGIDIERAQGIEGNLHREQKKRKTRLLSTSSSLIGYTESTSTGHCSLLWFYRFFDDNDDNDNKHLAAQVWEGIDLFTLILALLALAPSLVVSGLRLTPLVFSGSGSRRLALYHLHSATHKSRETYQAPKNPYFQYSYPFSKLRTRCNHCPIVLAYEPAVDQWRSRPPPTRMPTTGRVYRGIQA